jgi:outer membrane biosynthesis protein TonB
MTAKDALSFLRTRKGTVLSVALHVLVLGWGLFSFSARSMVVPPPEDLVPVDIVSDDNVAKAKQGIKDGKKENPKPLAEKIAEAKPVDDIVGKIDPKPVTETDAAPTPQPKPDKPVEKKPDPPKPVEKKPDPPTPVAEKKPDPPKPVAQDKPKPEEKKPDSFNADQISSLLNKDKAKQPPKPQANAAQPEPPKHKSERKFDSEKISSLINQRDPSHQAVTGAELNANAALGTAQGRAVDNSATWGSIFEAQVERCWKKPYASLETQKPAAAFVIQLRRDGTLEAPPVPEGVPASPYLRAYQESALRAIIACQPYNLPPLMFDEWKSFTPVFTEKK